MDKYTETIAQQYIATHTGHKKQSETDTTLTDSLMLVSLPQKVTDADRYSSTIHHSIVRHRLSPLAAFTSGAYFLHNGRR